MIKTKDKQNLKSIKGMDIVEKNMIEIIKNSHPTTYKICKRLIQSGGKRVRPALVLCSGQCFSEVNENMIMAATACECIHMASLVHDDVIDASNLRRGEPTVNVQKSNTIAILVGDFLFAKAFEILSKHQLNESMQIIVDAISKMCDGEIFQADHHFNFNQTRKDYYLRIYEKTGALIAAATQIGAIEARASMNEIHAFKKYGEYLGYAYQIIDDILDFTSDAKTLGKPICSDLKEGNITLPILKLMEHKEYKKWLLDLYEYGQIQEKHLEIIRVLKDSYALEDAFKEAVDCIECAKNALVDVEDSLYKNILLELADKSIQRRY